MVHINGPLILDLECVVKVADSQVAELVDAKDFPLELNTHTGSNPVLTAKN